MDRFLQGVNVVMTAGLLLAIVATLLGKMPARLLFLTGVAVSGVCLLAAIDRGHTPTIVMQTVAFTAWCAGLYVRGIIARRQAGDNQQH